MPRSFRLLAVAASLAIAPALHAQAASSAGASATHGEYLGSSRILSEAVRVGNMLYLSGKLGTDSAGKGIAAETRSAMEAIKRTLEKYNSSLDRVVKCTVWLVDMTEWSAMNQVYNEYFTRNKPARSAVGTSALVGNGRVEIECMATVGS
jgi:2-iminobutanoate/2-iminopropanoate deaminase